MGKNGKGVAKWGRFRGERGAAFAEKIELELRLLHLAFSLGFSAFIHELAEAARMLAIKSLLQSGGDGFSSGESDCHSDPGHGLKEKPVGASGQNDRKHHKASSRAERHGHSIDQMRGARQLFPLSLLYVGRSGLNPGKSGVVGTRAQAHAFPEASL